MLPHECPAEIPPADATNAIKVVRATPDLRREMTRYVASIDEKVDLMSLNLELTGQFRDRLIKTR